MMWHQLTQTITVECSSLFIILCPPCLHKNSKRKNGKEGFKVNDYGSWRRRGRLRPTRGKSPYLSYADKDDDARMDRVVPNRGHCSPPLGSFRTHDQAYLGRPGPRARPAV